MTTSELAIGISLVSLIAQLLNAWLHQRLRADLLQVKETLLEKADARYASKEVCKLRHGMERIEDAASCRLMIAPWAMTGSGTGARASDDGAGA